MQNNAGCHAGECTNCGVFSQNNRPTAQSISYAPLPCFAVADAVLVADDINGAVEELVAESNPPSTPLSSLLSFFSIIKNKVGV